MKKGLKGPEQKLERDSKPESLPPEVCREVLRTCGCHNLRRAARLATQLYDDLLAPTGLRATQVVLLVFLAAENESTLSGLARKLAMSPSTLTRNIKPLERDGLVEVRAMPRRGKAVRLTDAGHRSLLDAVPYWQKAQRQFTDLVGEDRWDELSQRLADTVAAIRS